MNVRRYRLDPAAFAEVYREQLTQRLIWIASMMVLAAVGLHFYQPLSLGLEAASLALFVGIAAVVLVARVRRDRERARKAWNTLELMLGENALRLSSCDLPPVEVLRANVTRIVEAGRGRLLVYTSDGANTVVIPPYLNNGEEVRAQLRTWRSFQQPSFVQRAAPQAGWLLAVMGSWFAAMFVPNMAMAGTAGAILIGASAVQLRRIVNQKAIDNQTKASLVGAFVSLMLAPCLRLALFVVANR